MGAPTPPVIQEAFASGAGGSYITNPIPLTTSTAGAASYGQGFPPATMEAIASGGTPPFGQDMNGILYAITSHILALEAGQPYTYNSTISGALSGYAVGTILGTADGTGLWINTSAGNTTNPDTGGAGWQSLAAIGIVSITGLTNSNVTLTAVQAAKPILAFSGTLTGNVQITFPALQQEWLILNETTGSYTLTCKTASGTGVAIAQGGSSQPTGIYCDGTNIWAAYAPASATPSAVGPTPNTLALRDNVGRIFATYFNQNSNPAENPTIGSVAVQNSAADGFLRWSSLANFGSQMLGTFSSANPGYYKFPNGLILQWGKSFYNALNTTPFYINFPITFPNAGLVAVVSGSYGGYNAGIYSLSTTQLLLDMHDLGGSALYYSWIAIGY